MKIIPTNPSSTPSPLLTPQPAAQAAAQNPSDSSGSTTSKAFCSSQAKPSTSSKNVEDKKGSTRRPFPSTFMMNYITLILESPDVYRSAVGRRQEEKIAHSSYQVPEDRIPQVVIRKVLETLSEKDMLAELIQAGIPAGLPKKFQEQTLKQTKASSLFKANSYPKANPLRFLVCQSGSLLYKDSIPRTSPATTVAIPTCSSNPNSFSLELQLPATAN